MLLMMASELAATGALVICWFQGLSAGKSCWPSRAGTERSSRSSIFRIVREKRRRPTVDSGHRRANVDMVTDPPLDRDTWLRAHRGRGNSLVGKHGDTRIRARAGTGSRARRRVVRKPLLTGCRPAGAGQTSLL